MPKLIFHHFLQNIIYIWRFLETIANILWLLRLIKRYLFPGSLRTLIFVAPKLLEQSLTKKQKAKKNNVYTMFISIAKKHN